MEIFSCQSSYPRICPFPKITYFFVVRASCPQSLSYAQAIRSSICLAASSPRISTPFAESRSQITGNASSAIFRILFSFRRSRVDQWLCHLIFSCKHNILLVFFYYIFLFDRTSRLLADSKDIFPDTDCTGRYYDYFFSFRVALNSISFFLFSIHILSMYK